MKLIMMLVFGVVLAVFGINVIDTPIPAIVLLVMFAIAAMYKGSSK